MAPEQRLEGRKEECLGENIPGKEKTKDKGYKRRAYLVYSRNMDSMAGAEGTKGEEQEMGLKRKWEHLVGPGEDSGFSFKKWRPIQRF